MTCVQRDAGTGGYALAQIVGKSALEVGLVPDGVARVDVRYRTAGTVRGTVRSNVVAYRPPAGVALTLAGRVLRGPRRVVFCRLRRLILNSIPAQITWRDVHGQALRTFTPPPALLRDTLGGQAAATLTPCRARRRTRRRRRHEAADGPPGPTALSTTR